MGISNDTGRPTGAKSRTVYAAVEVSRKSWVVAVRPLDGAGIGVHIIPPADADALVELLDRTRKVPEWGECTPSRVLCCYEAGYEGFWLSRQLSRSGIEAVVLDPASLPLNQRAKRIKTDRVDATRMVQALAAVSAGE